MHLLTSTNRRILDAIRNGFDGAQNVILASAFVSSSGIELLIASIKALLVRGGRVSLYATFNGGAFTDPKFFKLLDPLEQLFPTQVEVYLYPSPTTLFHAKTFLFERPDKSWSGIVGSANLTYQALTGGNFEISAVASIPHAEIITIRDELSSLLAQGFFRRLTPELHAQLFAAEKGAGDEDSEESARERKAKTSARQTQVKAALNSAKPIPLPPLPALLLPATVYVEDLCATGIGVATDDDLADLSVSVDLGVFVRANVLAKESTKRIGFVSESTKKGHSFSLIDDDVRDTVRTARKSIGKTIGLRAVDFGYLRWVPHRFYDDAQRAIASNPDVRGAREVVGHTNVAIKKHVDKVRGSFKRTMARVVDNLKLQPKREWNEKALRKPIRAFESRSSD